MFSPVKEKGSSSVKEKGSSPVKDTRRLPRATDAAYRSLSPQQNPREKPHVATEESQGRCQKSPSSNFMAKRPPASPSGAAVRYQYSGDLSCDRRPSAREAAPYRWRRSGNRTLWQVFKTFLISAGATHLRPHRRRRRPRRIREGWMHLTRTTLIQRLRNLRPRSPMIRKTPFRTSDAGQPTRKRVMLRRRSATIARF